MKSNFRLIVFFVLNFLCISVFAQINPDNNSVALRKDEKSDNLERFNEFSIIYHKTSRGLDSISTELYCKEIMAKRDTIYAKPIDITTFRLLDTLRAYSESKYYPSSTDIWFKIPVKEIEYIKAKKQPLNKITGTILSLSYVTLLCSPFIAMSQNAEVSNFGVNLFLVSVPVLAVSFSVNTIWAKKKYRFDPHRTNRKVWQLSK